MTLPIFIPPCFRTPSGPYHLPPPEKPLRIQIEGPLVAIQRLFPHISWHLDMPNPTFPQPAGPELARLTYQEIYGRDVCAEIPSDLVVRDEYLGWVLGEPPLYVSMHLSPLIEAICTWCPVPIADPSPLI